MSYVAGWIVPTGFESSSVRLIVSAGPTVPISRSLTAWPGKAPKTPTTSAASRTRMLPEYADSPAGGFVAGTSDLVPNLAL